MSEYSFSLFSLSSASFSISGIASQYAGGDQWDWRSSEHPTVTTPADTNAAAVTVSVKDTDATPNLLNDDSGSSQTLSQPLTLNGHTYAAGSTIEDEYEINLSDSANPGGTQYRFVAISINGQIVAYTWEGAQPPAGTKLYYTYGNAQDIQSLDPGKASHVVPCFAAGTLVATPTGPRSVESLTRGDMVLTAEHGFQRIEWVGQRHVDAAMLEAAPQLRPIRIAHGALGADLPSQDLLVSPQHRMLVHSAIARRISGEEEVLVPAKFFVGLPGIEVAQDVTDVTYVHLLLPNHEIIFANGASAESLYTGKELPKLLDKAAREELLTLFPDLFAKQMQPARILLNGKLGRALAERHLRNGKQLFNDRLRETA